TLHRRLILTGAIGLAAAAASAQPAARFPERPVRMVVPFAPGGSTDIFARLVAAKMSEDLGQQIVVDNKPGADIAAGAEAVARSAPD
uniref:tripartite tricarboxylate transporter substrate-binding protein n=1 Tax=Escherichia coli TaxID=562 RepID=UPI00207C5C89